VVITIPAAPGGLHDVLSKGATSGQLATKTIRIKPSLVLAPTSGTSNTRIAVTFNGFLPGEVIELRWYVTSGTIKTIKTGLKADARGTVKYTFKVPSGQTNGKHKVEGVGSLKSKASVNFTLSGVTTASVDKEANSVSVDEQPDQPKPTRTPRPTRVPTETPAQATQTPVPESESSPSS